MLDAEELQNSVNPAANEVAAPVPLPAEGTAPVATVRDLHVVYRRRDEDVHAVAGISLDVRRGEILAVVGESGCGKTTFGLALTGLLLDETKPPRVSGSIEVLGVDLTSASARARQELRRHEVGAVFQNPMTSLNPTMTIGKQLGEVTRSNTASVEMLSSVGVTAAQRRLRAYPHELSGGQRQRVMMAIAIAKSPALVVADEPTTALDVTIQAQVLTLIEELRDSSGAAFVFVTHDLGVASTVADRIAVFYAGRLVEIGPTNEVLGKPSHPYTMGLLRSRITMRTDDTRPLPSLAGEPPRPQAELSSCPFASRCEFVQPECSLQVPELRAVADTRVMAACIRANEPGLWHQHTTTPAAPKRSASTETPATATSDTVVRLEAIEKNFKLRGRSARSERLRALRSLDLDVRRGECLAIVGESGCGKSTLLRVIAGLLKPDGGSYEVLGDRRRAQMVFQDAAASLTPWLSVGEQIGERLPRGTTRDDRRKAVAEALHRVSLPPDIAQAKPKYLSGGQCQRVALARAIVVPPDVLLCDEPTSSLDVSLAANVLNMISLMRHNLGMSVIFVTHDLAAARFIADRIAVMYLGRIVEIGLAHDVANRPAHPYTKALIAAVPDLSGPRPQATGELPDPLHPPGGCPYHPRCAAAIPECQSAEPALIPFDGKNERWGACVHLTESRNGSN
jgi:peptide/nickel transport system ATP-binding protein